MNAKEPLPADEPLPPAPPPPAWQAAPRDLMDVVRRTALVLALAFLAISLVVAYYSANSIVSIWFEDQWVPVARLVLALLVAGIAGAAVVRLTRRGERRIR